MPNYKMVILSNPVEGREDEYNDWYSNTHLQDLVAVPGIVSAQRFKMINSLGRAPSYRYLALYEVATDDLDATVAEMLRRGGTDAMVVPDSIDADGAFGALFEPCTPVVRQK